jgi:hypothetical protein
MHLRKSLTAFSIVVATAVTPQLLSAQDALFIDSSGDVGVGTNTPGQKFHVQENVDANTFILVENLGTGTASNGTLRAASNAAAVNFQAHGSGRVISRFGTSLAGWAEFLQVTGNGLIVGTFAAKPLILGTNSTKVLEITPTGSILHRGSTIHADYVFEPDFALESIDEHAEFMWSNKHLPGIAPARKDENGLDIVDLGQDRRGVVEELEKAHIYIDQLNDRLTDRERRLAELELQYSSLEKRLLALEAAGRADSN